MSTALVLLDGWQVECCGGDQRVGDEVSWQLELCDDELPIEVGPPLAGVVELPPDDPGWIREAGLEALTATTAGAGYVRTAHFTAYGRELPPAGTRVEVRPLLHEDHHAMVPDTPETVGTIRRIRGVDVDFDVVPAPGGERTWGPDLRTVRVRDVPELAERRAGPWRYLVDLELTGAGAAAPPPGPGSAGSPG